MAERSRFWTTNNTGDGPSIGYSTSDWEKIVRHWFQSGDEANGGVLFGIGNALACSGAASPISVNTGAAVVYGHYYENDASLGLAVTTPVVGTTGGRVVLRVNWAAQTVRLFAVRNTDGLSAIPALTQSAGTTWEISLATFTITTGGVIALTDTRKFIKFSTKIYGDQLDISVADNATLEYASNVLRVKDAGITAAKLAAAIAGNGLSGGAGSPLAVNVDGATLEINADILRVLAGGIGATQLANDSVDDTKVGNRVPQVIRRQGASATDWPNPGTSTQIPGAVRIQAGSIQWTGAAASFGQLTVTFPIAFSAAPLVFAIVATFVATQPAIAVTIGNPSTTATIINWRDANGNTYTALTLFWFAIGTE